MGTLIVAALAAACWLDHRLDQVTAVAGVVLLPVSLVFVAAASREMLDLLAAGGMRPVRWAVYGGNLLIVAAGWIAVVCHTVCGSPQSDSGGPGLLTPGVIGQWTMLALATALLGALLAEMWRYEKPGGVIANLAAAALAVIYVGFLFSFLVQLRLTWGIGALASVVIVVKLGDVGAYTTGRLLGRHRMAPVLSPGKTVEGAVGAVVLACAGSWATFGWLVPATTPPSLSPAPWYGWIVFGLLMAAAGIFGDLAESLLKRDAGRKDSGTWLPGFGGMLDLLDSLLLAAPVAYACWAFGVVGR